MAVKVAIRVSSECGRAVTVRVREGLWAKPHL